LLHAELPVNGSPSSSVSQVSLTSNKTSSKKKPEVSRATELKSTKVTSAHHASIAARDEAYEVVNK
jgi:hypothetical protein